MNTKYIKTFIYLLLFLIGGGLIYFFIEKKDTKIIQNIYQGGNIEVVINNDNSRNLSEDFMCFNVNSSRIDSWEDLEFINAVNELNPRMLRFPGGEIGNYWNWERGGLIEDISMLPDGLPNFLRYKARQYENSKLEDFKKGLDGTNTKPIFVLNMLSSTLENQIAMLKKAEEIGMEIKYVELGNELYFNIPNYKRFYPTPQDYAETAQEWILRIKEEFPDAKLAVLGIIPAPYKPERLQIWNETMFSTITSEIDAIIIHNYNNYDLKSKKSPEGYYPFFKEEDVPLILGSLFKEWDALQQDDKFQL